MILSLMIVSIIMLTIPVDGMAKVGSCYVYIYDMMLNLCKCNNEAGHFVVLVVVVVDLDLDLVVLVVVVVLLSRRLLLEKIAGNPSHSLYIPVVVTPFSQLSLFCKQERQVPSANCKYAGLASIVIRY